MSIEIVTDHEGTYDKQTLEQNAINLIYKNLLEGLNNHDFEAWEIGLVGNILQTLKNRQDVYY